jgi:hypothetical protein
MSASAIQVSCRVSQAMPHEAGSPRSSTNSSHAVASRRVAVVITPPRRLRECRLEALAVEVLTALGELDRAVRDAELRARGALLAMTHDEGLSMREAVEG